MLIYLILVLIVFLEKVDFIYIVISCGNESTCEKRELQGGDPWILYIIVDNNISGLYLTLQSLTGEWEVLFPCGANFIVNRILPAIRSGCFRVAEVSLEGFDTPQLSM